MSDLFPGDARALPGASGFAMARRFSVLEAVPPPPPPPVTHAVGYEPFVRFATERGADPRALATDLDAFEAFVHAHRDALLDPALTEAAAIFLGDLLVVLHPGAVWRSTPAPEVGTDALSIPVRDAFAGMRDRPELAGAIRMRLLPEWDDADAHRAAVDRAMDAAAAATAAVCPAEAPPFVRPPLAAGPFLDERGEPIPYGNRWPDQPPEDAYSRVTHTERFAPLHDLGDALVAHLERNYDVVVTRTRDTDGDDVVTLRPTAGAPLRLTFTGFPGLRMEAGLLARDSAPACGCDACDETAETAAERFEEEVLAVVAGAFTERLPERPRAAAYSLGTSGSGGLDLPLEEERLVAVEDVAALGDAAWPAWPLRSRPDTSDPIRDT